MLRDTTPTAIALDGQPADGSRVAAVYRCRVALEDLYATDHPDIKFCEQCKQKVFKVVDFDGFEKAVAAKGCVWGPNDIKGDEPERPDVWFGVPRYDHYDLSSSPLEWDE